MTMPDAPRRQPPWDDEKDVIDLPEGYAWTPQETWVWARILRGDVANLSVFADDGAGWDANKTDDSGALTPWSDKRVLRDVFLRVILFQEPWSSVRARGRVWIQCATIDDSLDWAGERFSDDLLFDHCRFANAPAWQRLHVGGVLALQGSRFESGLSADGIVIGDDLFCRSGFTSKGEIGLVGASIGGNVEFDGSEISDALHADGIKIGGDLYLRDMKGLGSADFLSARVHGVVQLRGSNISGVIDFTNARIDGELHTAQNQNVPIWGADARLILRNARLGALAGGAGTFPQYVRGKPAPMDLVGLSYERLGGLRAAEGGSLAKARVPALKAWLAAGHEPNEFTPGPYRTLANALVEAGQSREANEVLHAMRAHEAKCEPDFWRRWRLRWSGRFIGFGHRSWYGLVWFACLVGLGAAFGLNITGVRPFDFGLAGIAEFFRWLGFSFGNAIPLVSLDKTHETFLAEQFAAFRGHPPYVGIAWTFYMQKVLGFIILSYLAAGVSGLASRQRD